MRALIVEDDATGAELLRHIIKPYAEVEIANNGKIAIEKFCAAIESGKPFDLICLDIMMPEVNGQAVLRHIREYEQENGVSDADAAKVIMISALDDSGNILNAFQVGCEAYLTKPIETKKLINQLKELGLIKDD
ncbi:MAG: response regulator [Bdellovibrionales bacterium]|nr:response regulator [Bdellovibrionales bacterium]